MKKLFASLVVCAAMAGMVTTQTGCPAALTAVDVLSGIALVVQDAQLIIQEIQTLFPQFAAQNNISPAQQAQFQQLAVACLDALSTGTATINGIQNVQQSDYDAAFASFRTAYADLNSFLLQIGMKTTALTASPSKVHLRDPIIIKGYTVGR